MSNRTVQLQDASITLTGSSQTLLAAQSTTGPRSFLLIGNPSASAAHINLTGGTAAANGKGCIELAPAGSAGSWILFSSDAIPGNAITAIGTLNAFVTCVWAP